MDPGTGSRSNARLASAVRRCAVLLRLVAHPRTPARRRSAQTTTSRRMARAVHRHRSVRELGGGHRGRLRRRLSVRTSMPLTYERGLALDACERERQTSPRRFCHCVHRGRDAASPRSSVSSRPSYGRPNSGIAGGHGHAVSATSNQWGSHREHRAPRDARPVATRARELRDRPRSSSRHRHQWPTAASRLKEQRSDRGRRDCSVTDGAVRRGGSRTLATRPEQQRPRHEIDASLLGRPSPKGRGSRWQRSLMAASLVMGTSCATV
jgi:hypothetical protein